MSITLLLTNVWRDVLRANLVTKLKSTRFSSRATLETSRHKPDELMVTLKSAPNASQILAVVQSNQTSLDHMHILQAFRCLFALHKAGRVNEEIIKDPGFSVLCQNYKKHARAIEVKDAVEAVKILSILKVPVESLIVQTLLQIIRTNINNLNLRQIMFLNTILTKKDTRNHLVDALKLALPLAFQIHMPLELDVDDLPMLKDMLSYCSFYNLPDRCINNIVTAILLHDLTLDTDTAKYLIWDLCKINCNEALFPTRVQLLHLCCDILAHSLDKLPFEEVLRTASKLKGQIIEKHMEYYHEELMDAIANYTVNHQSDFVKSLLVARILSRIAHTHLILVEHVCQLAVLNPSMLSKASSNVLFSFIHCLSNSNFTPPPDTWDEIRRQISMNPVMDGKMDTLSWTKVCLELATLGYYEDKLLNRVFSKEFLDEYLARDNNFIDYLQLLTLYVAVKAFHSDKYKLSDEILDKAKSVYPLHKTTPLIVEALSKGLGNSNCIAKNVALPDGVVVDAMLFLEHGCPMELPSVDSNEKVRLEQLNLHKDGVIVCIMTFSKGCFSMNSKRIRGIFKLLLDSLEKKGYVVVAINFSDWFDAPDHERIPYLMREIEYKCEEIGTKLCALR